MYGDPNHVRWHHEYCWIRSINSFVVRVFTTRADAAYVSLPIVRALALGYGGSTRAPNRNLAAVRLALTDTIVDNFIFGDSAGIIKDLINFQVRYLHEQPGDPIRTKYMTTAELESWFTNIRERIADLVIT